MRRGTRLRDLNSTYLEPPWRDPPEADERVSDEVDDRADGGEQMEVDLNERYHEMALEDDYVRADRDWLEEEYWRHMEDYEL